MVAVLWRCRCARGCSGCCLVRLWGRAAPWAAARPRAVRAASFARRVVSKPARALRSLRRPPHLWGRVAVLARPGPAAAHGHRSQARPYPPAPSTPVGLGRWSVARRVLLQTSSTRGVFCVDSCVVVTNVVNPMPFSWKILVFWLRLTTFVTRVRKEGFEMLQFDDVCNAWLP